MCVAGQVQIVGLRQREPIFLVSHAPLAHAPQKRPASKRTKELRMAAIERVGDALTALVNNAALRKAVVARRIKADQVIAESQRKGVFIRILGGTKEAVERIVFHWAIVVAPQTRLVTKVSCPEKVSHAPRVRVLLVIRQMVAQIHPKNRKGKAKVLRKKDRPQIAEEHQGRAEKNPNGPLLPVVQLAKEFKHGRRVVVANGADHIRSVGQRWALKSLGFQGKQGRKDNSLRAEGVSREKVKQRTRGPGLPPLHQG